MRRLKLAIDRARRGTLPASAEGRGAVAFPLLTSPKLVEIRALRLSEEVEMGVEIDLAGTKHLFVVGEEGLIQFTDRKERPERRFLRIHNHRLRHDILAGLNDMHVDFQGIVSKDGISFAERVPGSFSLKDEDWLPKYGRPKFLGCQDLEERPYRFILDPERMLSPKQEKDLLGFVTRREGDMLALLTRLKHPSITFVTSQNPVRHWFYRWKDLRRMGIDLYVDDIFALVNSDGTMKDLSVS
ncbi:hypothetical protein ACFL5U_02455 [Candidatus Margulisiibacteriota bacterium]